MEIVLEKDFKGRYNVSEDEVAKILQKLGADLRPGIHIETVQICPMGKNVIQVTLNKNVDMSRFCNKEVHEIKEGVRISHIRQAGKREVILTIKGLHPHTLDDTVFKYLCCLGKIDKKKVILDTYKEGPLSGLQNGDRKYSVEFRTDIVIGPVQVIDGQQVTFSFPGQRRTCFRCFQTPNLCLGKGIARDCEAAGGEKVFLSDYMLKFWNTINYKPGKSELPSDLEVTEADYQIGGAFTPKQNRVAETPTVKFGGVVVKWFPKNTDHGAIMEFLAGHGLPEIHENINIKDNGQVVINQLEHSCCQKMIEEINGKKFNKRIFTATV